MAAGAVSLLRSLATLPLPPSPSPSPSGEAADNVQGLTGAMEKAQGLAQGLARKFVLGPFEQAVADLMINPLLPTETSAALSALVSLIDSDQERNLQRSVARSLGHLDACAVVVAAWRAHYKSNNSNNNGASTMTHPQQEVTSPVLSPPLASCSPSLSNCLPILHLSTLANCLH